MVSYTILVVEDNHEVRRMVTASIKTLGDEFEVLEVPSAEEALVVNASQALDLVVIDFRLPGMSGIDMVTRLRKRKPAMKIILVTGVEDQLVRKQVSEAAVDAFFFKPIDIQTFLDAIKRILSVDTPSPNRPPDESKSQAAASPITGKSITEPSTVIAAADDAKADTPSTVFERLSDLKKQVKAVSALLVNDTGQILEEAGAAVDIATGSPLLSALMRAFRSSLQVSQAMARGTSESLQYFAAPRQCIYVAPVGMNHALFVVTSGYFGPDKLGMIYHTIHLAVRDLQEILATEAAYYKEHPRPELPAEVAIDKETLAKVEGIFSHAPRLSSKERADGFWDNLTDHNLADGTPAKDVISYDQARDLGLTANEENNE
jgi:two-component system, response regulator, stage 0 sporulation protein F